jgi:hypothetical protein
VFRTALPRASQGETKESSLKSIVRRPNGKPFIDTADVYKKMLGRWVAERGLRDRMVIATKFIWNLDPGNPNAGGNGRKNVMRAIDASLRRLSSAWARCATTRSRSRPSAGQGQPRSSQAEGQRGPEGPSATKIAARPRSDPLATQGFSPIVVAARGQGWLRKSAR